MEHDVIHEAAFEEADALEQIDAVKRGAGAFVTNCFGWASRIVSWKQQGIALSGFRTESAYLLLEPQRDFHRLHYFAADPAALVDALDRMDRDRAQAYRTLVCDIVGRPADVDTMAVRFEGAGFSRRCSLQRMTRTTSSAAARAVASPTPTSASTTSSAPVALAAAADARAISAALDEHFDRYAEQIPLPSAIDRAIADGQVLVSRGAPGGEPVSQDDEALAGFLYFEIAGQTATVRYWFVDPTFRGTNVGGALMRAFFERCAGVTRQILWVVDSNERAKVRYLHYGFALENLCDRVMIKQKSEAESVCSPS